MTDALEIFADCRYNLHANCVGYYWVNGSVINTKYLCGCPCHQGGTDGKKGMEVENGSVKRLDRAL